MWDPIAAAHLARLASAIDKAGVTEHLRGVVRELWRANVERFDPDALHDDSSTLGYTAAKNVTNRMFAELRGRSGALQPAAHAVRDNQSVVVRFGDINVHFIKAPVNRGRNPRFTLDFRWEGREGRIAPAERNFERYSAPRVVEGHDPLFAVEVPEALERIEQCRDVFAVWGGDLRGQTAGWFGLPTTGPGSWLAVQSSWFDEEDSSGAGRSLNTTNSVGKPGFAELEEPQPRITLKPQIGEESNGG